MAGIAGRLSDNPLALLSSHSRLSSIDLNLFSRPAIVLPGLCLVKLRTYNFMLLHWRRHDTLFRPGKVQRYSTCCTRSCSVLNYVFHVAGTGQVVELSRLVSHFSLDVRGYDRTRLQTKLVTSEFLGYRSYLGYRVNVRQLMHWA